MPEQNLEDLSQQELEAYLDTLVAAGEDIKPTKRFTKAYNFWAKNYGLD